MNVDPSGHAPKWLIIVGITALAIAAITITIISCGAAAAGAGALATMAAYVTGIGTIATTVGAIAIGATYAISCLVVAGISAFAMADIQSVVTNDDNNYLGFLGNSYDTIKSSLYGIAFLLPFVGQYAPIQGESFYGNGKASEHGVPYSTYTQITPNGNNTAYYDAYGNQIYRIDTSHFHNGWKPHIHIFDWYMYDNVWRYVKDVIPY